MQGFLLSHNELFRNLDSPPKTYQPPAENQVFAAGLGLEPRYHPPEGRVLPLDDPAILFSSITLL